MARNLILVCGRTGTGKSASLEGLDDSKETLYLNCEGGKELPFPNQFNNVTVTDPMVLLAIFDQATKPATEGKVKPKTIIIDTLTFLMDMFVTQKVAKSDDTFAGWNNYGEYLRILFQEKIAKFQGDVIVLAHVDTTYSKAMMAMETKVPLQGKVGKSGVEAYFTNVVLTRLMTLDDLKPYTEDNTYLNITEDEKIIKVKNVYQTRITEDTTDLRIRGMRNAWTIKESFIDNNIMHVINRLNEMYGRS